jgi:hypothetical protein
VVYAPPFMDSKNVYAHVAANLEDWIDDTEETVGAILGAISIRIEAPPDAQTRTSTKPARGGEKDLIY